jgi:hypothetical protein
VASCGETHGFYGGPRLWRRRAAEQPTDRCGKRCRQATIEEIATEAIDHIIHRRHRIDCCDQAMPVVKAGKLAEHPARVEGQHREDTFLAAAAVQL